jgi:uncharacterized membrane protein YiaA
MRVFNSVQLTAMFAGFPFLLNWLGSAEFKLAEVGFYVGCLAYVWMFGAMSSIVYDQLGKEQN